MWIAWIGSVVCIINTDVNSDMTLVRSLHLEQHKKMVQFFRMLIFIIEFTHNMTKIKSWVTQSQVFQKSRQLKTMKWAPWATKIIPGFRLLASTCIVQELVANNHRLIRIVVWIFIHAAIATGATTTFFRCLCRRHCYIRLRSVKAKSKAKK